MLQRRAIPAVVSRAYELHDWWAVRMRSPVRRVWPSSDVVSFVFPPGCGVTERPRGWAVTIRDA